MLVNPGIQDFLDRLQGRRTGGGGIAPSGGRPADLAAAALSGIVRPGSGSFGFNAPPINVGSFRPEPPAPNPGIGSPQGIPPEPPGHATGGGGGGGGAIGAGLSKLGAGIEQGIKGFAATSKKQKESATQIAALGSSIPPLAPLHPIGSFSPSAPQGTKSAPNIPAAASSPIGLPPAFASPGVGPDTGTGSFAPLSASPSASTSLVPPSFSPIAPASENPVLAQPNAVGPLYSPPPDAWQSESLLVNPERGPSPPVGPAGSIPTFAQSQQFSAGQSAAPAPANNVEVLRQTLLNSGATPQGADGIIASMQGESGRGLNPLSMNNSGSEHPGVLNPHGSYGIAQWNGDRQTGLSRFSTEFGTSPSDINTQAGYVVHEMTSNPEYAPTWAAATNPNATAADVLKTHVTNYERPKNPQEAIATRLGNLSSSDSQTAKVSARPESDVASIQVPQEGTPIADINLGKASPAFADATPPISPMGPMPDALDSGAVAAGLPVVPSDTSSIQVPSDYSNAPAVSPAPAGQDAPLINGGQPGVYSIPDQQGFNAGPTQQDLLASALAQPQRQPPPPPQYDQLALASALQGGASPDFGGFNFPDFGGFGGGGGGGGFGGFGGLFG